ncbi:MAG: hypothetical protein J1D88_10010 [Treponema sp.]|nr:hypothetical protein [Treponema sp.]
MARRGSGNSVSGRLRLAVEAGDHYLYICDVSAVYANEAEQALFAWNGYAEIRPIK